MYIRYMLQRLLFISLLFLCSCTITKRVHRKGVLIEWNKRYSSQKKIVEQPTKELRGSKKNPLLKKIKEPIIDEELDNSLIDSIIEKTSHSDRFESKVTTQEEDVLLISNKVVHPILKNRQTRGEIETSTKRKRNSDVLVNIGIGLLIFGGVFVLSSFITIWGFSGFGSLFEFLVLSGNGLLIGILGFLLFLAIVVMFYLLWLLIMSLGGFTVGLMIGLSLILLGGISILLGKLLF